MHASTAMRTRRKHSERIHGRVLLDRARRTWSWMTGIKDLRAYALHQCTYDDARTARSEVLQMHSTHDGPTLGAVPTRASSLYKTVRIRPQFGRKRTRRNTHAPKRGRAYPGAT